MNLFLALVGIFSVILGAALRKDENKNLMSTQQGYNQENMRSQFLYNEEAADNADARQRAQFNDMYSPSAKVGQLKNAGLSVGLMYGGGGMGGSGGSATGAQGGGASLPSIGMPNMPGIDLMSGITQGLQGNQIMAIAKNEKEKTAGIKAEAWLKNEQARLAKTQAETSEATVPAQIAKILNETGISLEQLRGMKWQNDLNDEQKELLLQGLKNTVEGQIKDNLIKDQTLKLNEKQAAKFAEEILNLQAVRAEINARTKNEKQKQANWEKEFAQAVKRLESETGLKREQIITSLKQSEMSQTSNPFGQAWVILSNLFGPNNIQGYGVSR